MDPYGYHDGCRHRRNYLSRERRMNSEQFDHEFDLDRSIRLRKVIEEALSDIDMSGEAWNDYDKNGVPYWEKWGDK